MPVYMTADIEVTHYDGSAVSAVNRDRAGQRVDTDYLIVGAGALGMTFADQLLTDTDASIVIVDRRHMGVGGGWPCGLGLTAKGSKPSAWPRWGQRDTNLPAAQSG